MDIDTLRLVAAFDRSIESLDREGKPVRLLVASHEYPTTPDDLWDALTDAERIPRWFLPVSGDLTVGGHYQFEGNAGGEILACDPPRSFDVTWEYGGDVSWVTVVLTPSADGEGTRLELRHTAPVSEEMWKEFGPGAVGIGWELGLMGLDLHLASAAAVDPEEAQSFLATEDGRAFISAISDRWAEASIEAGEDPTAAREAAARTTAAYTGVAPTEDPPAEDGSDT